MARLDDARHKRPGETGSRDAAFGTVGMLTLDPFLQLSNKLLEGWMAVGNEILEFSKHQLDLGLEMSKAMAQSTNLNEAIDLQAKYTRSMTQDCFSEANKIVDLSTRSVLDSLSNLRQQARESAQHVEAAQ